MEVRKFKNDIVNWILNVNATTLEKFVKDLKMNDSVPNLIGPSGVRALPLAAGINEGGHYFRYFST